MIKKILLLALLLPFLLTAESDPAGKYSDESSEIQLFLRIARESIPADMDKAVDYTNKALELSRRTGLKTCEVEAVLLLAEIQKEQGNYINSFKKYQQALDLSENNKLNESIVDSYTGLADFYVDINEYDSAINYLFKALDKSILIDDDYRSGIVQSALSYSYRKKKSFDISSMYAEEAIEIFKKSNDEFQLATAYILLGKNYLDQNDLEKAFEIDNIVLDITENTNDHRNRGLAYNDLAWNFWAQGDFNKALEYNKEALQLRRDNGIKVLEVSSLINIAILFMDWERYADAADFFSQAEKLIDEVDSFSMREMKLRYYKELSELNLLLGNVLKALENYKEFHRIEVELAEIKNNQDLNKIRTQFEIDRFNKEENNLNRLQQMEIKRQRVIILAFVVIVFLTIVLGFFLYSRYRLKKKLSDKLSKTNYMLQKVNEKTSKEIAEKKRMEKIINSNAEHLKLVNHILRHDITNDLVTIKSGLSVYKANKDEAILDELAKRIGKSVNLIHSMREFEEFMNEHVSLKVIDPVSIVNTIAENYQNIQINLNGNCRVMGEDSFISATGEPDQKCD